MFRKSEMSCTLSDSEHDQTKCMWTHTEPPQCYKMTHCTVEAEFPFILLTLTNLQSAKQNKVTPYH